MKLGSMITAFNVKFTLSLDACCFPVAKSSICERSHANKRELTVNSWKKANKRMSVPIIELVLNYTEQFCCIPFSAGVDDSKTEPTKP